MAVLAEWKYPGDLGISVCQYHDEEKQNHLFAFSIKYGIEKEDIWQI